jgi:hypothetical protein
MGLFRRNSTLRHRYTYLHHMAKTSWNFCLVLKNWTVCRQKLDVWMLFICKRG